MAGWPMSLLALVCSLCPRLAGTCNERDSAHGESHARRAPNSTLDNPSTWNTAMHGVVCRALHRKIEPVGGGEQRLQQRAWEQMEL